jgi:transcriptional regulator with XRE-family HTH domain
VGRVIALPTNLGGHGFDQQVVTALLRARHLSGLDRQQFARLLSITAERLATWEAGEEPLPAIALLQAASLAGVSVEVLLGRRSLIRRLEELEHQVQELSASFRDPRLLSRRLHALLDDWPAEDRRYDDVEVKRREFLALMLLTLGASAQLLDVERLVGMLTSGRVDKHTLNDLRTITREYARRAETASPPDLLQATRTHLTVLTGLLGGVASPALTRELQSIAGETAVLVGGLSFRVESRRQAQACFAFARYLAREAGDQELDAYTLARTSSLPSVPAATGTPYDDGSEGAGDAIALLDEAEAAARSASTPYLYAGVLVRRAEEHAARSEELEAFRDLAAAARAVANGQLGQDRFFGARLQIRRYEGLCAALLGQPDAATILEESLAGTEASLVSERCGQLADLGTAYAMQNEVDQACAKLGEAFSMAVRGGHAMRVQRVRGIRGRFLAAWATRPAVRHLDEQLRGWAGA